MMHTCSRSRVLKAPRSRASGSAPGRSLRRQRARGQRRHHPHPRRPSRCPRLRNQVSEGAGAPAVFVLCFPSCLSFVSFTSVYLYAPCLRLCTAVRHPNSPAILPFPLDVSFHHRLYLILTRIDALSMPRLSLPTSWPMTASYPWYHHGNTTCL